MQELHELQEEKLLLSQIKNKTNIEKVHRKSIKRASKKGNMNEIDQKNKQEFATIIVDQQTRVTSLSSLSLHFLHILSHSLFAIYL